MQKYKFTHTLAVTYTRTKPSREIRTAHESGVSPTYKEMQARINNAQSTFVVQSP